MPDDPQAPASSGEGAGAEPPRDLTLEVEPNEEPGTGDGFGDIDSQPLGALDLHSVPLETPVQTVLPPASEGAPVAGSAAAPAAPAPATSAPPATLAATATRPVVGATVQATQAAVSTANEATNQVCSVVQQK